jgi:hypothetical protein
MKKSNIYICAPIETKMNKIIDKINEIDSAIQADPLQTSWVKNQTLLLLTDVVQVMNLTMTKSMIPGRENSTKN